MTAAESIADQQLLWKIQHLAHPMDGPDPGLHGSQALLRRHKLGVDLILFPMTLRGLLPASGYGLYRDHGEKQRLNHKSFDIWQTVNWFPYIHSLGEGIIPNKLDFLFYFVNYLCFSSLHRMPFLSGKHTGHLTAWPNLHLIRSTLTF